MSKEYILVKQICEDLKLGDDKNVEAFFSSGVKALERSITANKKNIEVVEFELERKTEELADEIEDAQEAIGAAFRDIDVSQIKTNAARKAYSQTYWGRVQAAEDYLMSLQDKQKELKEEAEERIAAYRDQIEKLEARINKITG